MELQGYDFHLEVRSEQGPSRLQCVFSAFPLVIANCPPQAELAMNTHNMVADMHRSALETRGDTDNRDCTVCETRAF